LPSDVENLCKKEMDRIGPVENSDSCKWKDIKVNHWENGKPSQQVLHDKNPKETYCVECQADFIQIKDSMSNPVWCINTPFPSGTMIKAGNKGRGYREYIIYRLQSGVLELGSQRDWDSTCPFKQHAEDDYNKQGDMKEAEDLWKKCEEYARKKGGW